MTILFITGIDTDIGKTVVCGALAKTMLDMGLSVYTQKLVETGCVDDISNDLLEHERIVGKSFNHAESELHCPYRFTTPASPHLAAERDGRKIDTVHLSKQMTKLASQTNHLLVEGAGGLCVPLNQDKLIVDFIVEQGLPVVLVTSPRLGSINHTLLSLELCKSKNIDVRAIIYNHYLNIPNWMVKDTRVMLSESLKKSFPVALFLDLGYKTDSLSITVKQMRLLLADS